MIIELTETEYQNLTNELRELESHRWNDDKTHRDNVHSKSLIVLKHSERHDIEKDIREKAIKIANDYPNIETCSIWECLYAIESSYEGTSLANDDCHKFLRYFKDKLNLDDATYMELWDSIKESTYE